MEYTTDKIQEIVKLHSEGKSPTEIAKMFNTYNTTIRRILLKENVILKNQSEALASITINPFQNYKTDEISAYWLGYLISDGSVSMGKGGYRVIINTNKDPQHLQKYANYIGKPLRRYFNKTHNVWEYSVVFYNKTIVQWLDNLGITPNKSLTFRFKGELNSNLVRGVFDGDGCIHADGRISLVTGSNLFKEQLLEYLIKEGFYCKAYEDKRGNHCWNIYITGQEHFYRTFYASTNLAMQRKKTLLGQFIGNNK